MSDYDYLKSLLTETHHFLHQRLSFESDNFEMSHERTVVIFKILDSYYEENYSIIEGESFVRHSDDTFLIILVINIIRKDTSSEI